MAEREIPVLLVEDNPAEARLLQETLAEAPGHRYAFDHVVRLDQAVERLGAGHYELVVLDVNLPDSDGLKGLKTLNGLGMGVPVVVLTGVDDERLAVEAMRAGAQDYIVKGEQRPSMLARTLRYAIERHGLSIGADAPDHHGHSGGDETSDLPPRQAFNAWLGQAIRESERTGRSFAMLLVSLDRFRTIVDAMGAEAGAALLRAAGQRLGALVSDRDQIARLGGHDFGLILPAASSHIAAAEAARRVIQALSRPYLVNAGELHVGASIGIVVPSAFGPDAGQLLRQADLAMQSAKEAGGNTYQFYSARLHEATAQHLALESNLRVALQRRELTLHFQPCIELASGRVVSMEALSRWHHPELGLISPADFIPVAEESGLIIALDAWAMRAACTQNTGWRQAGHTGVSVAVNVSARHFADGGIVALVEKVVRETGVSPQSVELELTETALMKNPELAAHALQRLKAMGIVIAVDDFGIGYSSLSYLRNLPVDILKIDRSFISKLTEDTKDAAVVASIIALAKSLGLTVIAEGVETPAQLRWLRANGCDRVQGFLISAPIPSPDIAELNAAYRQKRLHCRIA